MRTRAGLFFLTSMFLVGLLGVSEARGQAYCTSDADCSDGNVCTLDRCIANRCNNIPTVGAPCQLEDLCISGICGAVCIPQGPINCDDHNPCTVDNCDSSIGCTHQGTTCDDGNLCTIDTCTPSCLLEPCDGQPALSDTCAHQPVDCADADPCTLDRCDPSIGCTHQGTICDDGNPCTVDTCSSPGQCIHQSACDDGISCTKDLCEPSTGRCWHDPNGSCAENPRSVGYWQSACRGNGNHQDTITNADVSFIRASSRCELPIRIHSIDDVCQALSENGDEPCLRAEQEFVALALNLNHLRVSPSDGIDSRCSYNYTVRDAFAEAAVFVCNPPPGCLLEPCDVQPDFCGVAECESREINQGRALHLHGLVLSRLANGTVRLTWIPPVAGPDSLSTTPHRYRVWRATNASDPFVQIAEVTDPTFDDTAASGERLVYEVTPVW